VEYLAGPLGGYFDLLLALTASKFDGDVQNCAGVRDGRIEGIGQDSPFTTGRKRTLSEAWHRRTGNAFGKSVWPILAV
jgi:hypothetical protein